MIATKREALEHARAFRDSLKQESLEMMRTMKLKEETVLKNVQGSLLKYGRFQSALDVLVANLETQRQTAIQNNELLTTCVSPYTVLHTLTAIVFVLTTAAFVRSTLEGRLEALSDQLSRLELRAQLAAEDLHQVLLFKERGQFYNFER